MLLVDLPGSAYGDAAGTTNAARGLPCIARIYSRRAVGAASLCDNTHRLMIAKTDESRIADSDGDNPLRTLKGVSSMIARGHVFERGLTDVSLAQAQTLQAN